MNLNDKDKQLIKSIYTEYLVNKTSAPKDAKMRGADAPLDINPEILKKLLTNQILSNPQIDTTILQAIVPKAGLSINDALDTSSGVTMVKPDFLKQHADVIVDSYLDYAKESIQNNKGLLSWFTRNGKTGDDMAGGVIAMFFKGQTALEGLSRGLFSKAVYTDVAKVDAAIKTRDQKTEGENTDKENNKNESTDGNGNKTPTSKSKDVQNAVTSAPSSTINAQRIYEVPASTEYDAAYLNTLSANFMNMKEHNYLADQKFNQYLRNLEATYKLPAYYLSAIMNIESGDGYLFGQAGSRFPKGVLKTSGVADGIFGLHKQFYSKEDRENPVRSALQAAKTFQSFNGNNTTFDYISHAARYNCGPG